MFIGSRVTFSYAIASDSDGNVFVTGLGYNPSTYDSDVVLMRCTPEGEEEWVKFFGNANGTLDVGYSLTIDKRDNVIVGGRFEDDPIPPHISNDRDAFLLKVTSNGELIWSFVLEGEDTELVTSVSVDDNSNIYVTGNLCSQEIDFDPGPGKCIRSSDSASCFLSKYDPDGKFLWVKVSDDAFIDKVVILPDGNIALSGLTPAQSTRDIFTHSGDGQERYAYIALYDSDGNFKRATSWKAFNSTDITSDESGNIYASGIFENTIQSNKQNQDSGQTESDVLSGYVHKYDLNLENIWIENFNTGDENIPKALAIDDLGNLYVAGTFLYSFCFPPSLPEPVHSDNRPGVFVGKLNSDGDNLWFVTFSGTHNTTVEGIDLLPGKDIVITGKFSGTLDLNPGPGIYQKTVPFDMAMAYVTCFDTDGQYKWSVTGK